MSCTKQRIDRYSIVHNWWWQYFNGTVRSCFALAMAGSGAQAPKSRAGPKIYETRFNDKSLPRFNCTPTLHAMNGPIRKDDKSCALIPADWARSPARWILDYQIWSFDTVRRRETPLSVLDRSCRHPVTIWWRTSRDLGFNPTQASQTIIIIISCIPLLRKKWF